MRAWETQLPRGVLGSPVAWIGHRPCLCARISSRLWHAARPSPALLPFVPCQYLIRQISAASILLRHRPDSAHCAFEPC